MPLPEPSKAVKKGHRRPPTLAAVREKCRDCLGGRKIGFDCQISDCALYPWQPWQGRPAPSR